MVHKNVSTRFERSCKSKHLVINVFIGLGVSLYYQMIALKTLSISRYLKYYDFNQYEHETPHHNPNHKCCWGKARKRVPISCLECTTTIYRLNPVFLFVPIVIRTWSPRFWFEKLNHYTIWRVWQILNTGIKIVFNNALFFIRYRIYFYPSNFIEVVN